MSASLPSTPVQLRHNSNQLRDELIDFTAHIAQVPSLVNACSCLFDHSACGIVLSVSKIGGLFERRQLDRPDRLLDGIVGLLVTLAPPESLNDILNANDSLLTEQLLDDHVVGDGNPFHLFVFKVAALSHDILKNGLGGGPVGHIILDQ